MGPEEISNFQSGVCLTALLWKKASEAPVLALLGSRSPAGFALFTWLIHGNLDVTLIVVFCRSVVKVLSKFCSGVEVLSKFRQSVVEVLSKFCQSVAAGCPQRRSGQTGHRQNCDKISTNFGKLWDPWERKGYHGSAT